jgi:hypothetical protein
VSHPAHSEAQLWNEDTITLDIEPAGTIEEEVFSTDHYEILRLGPQADEETIERVYRTLADRFHPDTPSTGDPETFLRVREAYETLSNPVKRAEYNALRQYNRGLTRFRLQGREFFAGVVGEQNRRLAALCLLYRQRVSTHESPGLTLLDLEQSTGCTREELTSALWYLCEKKWAKLGESTEYSITAEGFDVVEDKIEERFEFRALATACYYGLPSSAADRLYFPRAPEPLLCAAPESLPPPPEPTFLALPSGDNHEADTPKNDGSAVPMIDIFRKLGQDRARMAALGVTDNEVMKYYSDCGAKGEHKDQAFATLVRRFDLTLAEAAFVGDVLGTCAPF